MTHFVPNTTATIERDNGTPPATGTYVEGYGPDVSNWTTVATGAPAYLYEDSQTTWDPTTSRSTIREVVVIRLRPGTPVLDRDRITDERTGAVYQVDTVSTPGSVIGAADVRAVTIRISS